jgi:NAD+ diphosphatase
MNTDEVWVLVNNGRFCVQALGDYRHQKRPLDAAVFLPVGRLNGQLWSVALMPSPAQEMLSLRSLLVTEGADIFGLLSRAAQLEHWWLHHQFCGRCGARTTLNDVEMALHCAACNMLYFPRISPCIIVLVTQGQRCLLARHARVKSTRFSCLAGFIEVGESAEQALIREVKEEVGIEVANMCYITSQNWPFPSQLMLGFMAEYAGGELTVDGIEIEQAAWFDGANLPELPPAGTLSRLLIDRFLGV